MPGVDARLPLLIDLDGLQPERHTEEPPWLVTSRVRNGRLLEALNRRPSSLRMPRCCRLSCIAVNTCPKAIRHSSSTDNSMARKLSGRRATLSLFADRFVARLSVLHAVLRQPEDNSSTLHELAQSMLRSRRGQCDVVNCGKSWRCDHGGHRRDVHNLGQHCHLVSSHDVLAST